MNGLRIIGNKIPYHLQYIKDMEFLESTKILEIQQGKIRDLLKYSHKNVPHYEKILENCGVVTGSGEINLEKFTQIPLLTKEDIRTNFHNLKSDLKRKNVYRNTSGGSTGVPVEFLQDRNYNEWNISNKMYYAYMVDKDIGEKEIKLWGSERDIIEGTIGTKQKLTNLLYNRRFLNSFKMSESDMRDYIDVFNTFKPKNVWTYVDSIYELSKYVKKNDLEIWSPSSIIVTAGTLYPFVRTDVENVFQTSVYNQYGSREVGDIASECSRKEGLHLFPYTHFIEVVDENGTPLPPGKEGEIVVTLLTNYTMPLIRYRIGDTGILSRKSCSCTRGFPLLKSVSGRITDHFINEKEELIHGEYFTHLFYHRGWVKQFQVIQENLSTVIVKIVPTEIPQKTESEIDMNEIEQKIKMVMGEETNVEFEICEDIEPSSSGKYLYTISKMK